MPTKFKLSAIVFFTALALSACAVGPDYVRPELQAELPAAFKENWQPAQPQDQAIPLQWWTLFQDETLNTLIAQLSSANQTLAQADANYRAASALVDNARAAYLPGISADVAHTRAGNKPGSISNSNTAEITASWELDLWGRVRRSVEAQEATALASYASKQATLLSLQAQLTQDYLQLRVLDAQQDLLNRSVAEYQKSLTLTQHQYQAGIVPSDSILLAQTQLKNTQAQALDVGILRAQLEHAIAILVGKTPSSFTIPVIVSAVPALPQLPVSLPSTLLERRPDIAAAERAVAAANAQIGVTKAAFFPTLSLGAGTGYQSNSLANWISLPNRVWSLGPTLALNLFDGGAQHALSNQAIANYDASVASYRQTVLAGLQNVEDNLVALRILQQEATVQHEASVAAKQALAVTLNQYKAGTVNYLNVVSAQTSALTSERAELTLTNAQLTATVGLIKALGGGWNNIQH